MRKNRIFLAVLFASLSGAAFGARTIFLPRYSRRVGVTWASLTVGQRIGLILDGQVAVTNLSNWAQTVTVTLKGGSTVYGIDGSNLRPPFDRCVYIAGGGTKAIGVGTGDLAGSQEISAKMVIPPNGDHTFLVAALFHSTFHAALPGPPIADLVTAFFAPKIQITVDEDRGAIQAVISPQLEGVTSGSYPCLGSVAPFFGPSSIPYAGSDVPLLGNGGRAF